MNNWYVYIVRCSDKSLYAGITKDIKRRIEEHNSNDQLGSKYTRTRRPVKLVYHETQNSRSKAAKRECEIKKLRRIGKEKLVKAGGKFSRQGREKINLKLEVNN